MITKEQLQVMSDFEVNKALAELVGFDTREMPTNVCLARQSFGWAEIDYCSNPSDVMPLVFENRISLIENDIGYTAYHNFSIFEDINYRIEHGAYFGDKNPLRAIACCLILVLQEQKR